MGHIIILLLTASVVATKVNAYYGGLPFNFRPNENISNPFPVKITGNRITNCEPSVTTISGQYIFRGSVCKNQLLLNEEFNSFNQNLWEHEENINGGGVYKLEILYLAFGIFGLILFLEIHWPISVVYK